MGVAPGSGYFFLSILFAVIWSVSMCVCVWCPKTTVTEHIAVRYTKSLAIIASFYRRKNTFPPSRLYLSVTDWLAGWLTDWLDGLTTWHQSSLCLALYLLLSTFEQIKHKRSPKHRVRTAIRGAGFVFEMFRKILHTPAKKEREKNRV